MIFYHTKLHHFKFQAVASFKDGSTIKFNLKADNDKHRLELLDQCEEMARRIAASKGESCE